MRELKGLQVNRKEPKYMELQRRICNMIKIIPISSYIESPSVKQQHLDLICELIESPI